MNNKKAMDNNTSFDAKEILNVCSYTYDGSQLYNYCTTSYVPKRASRDQEKNQWSEERDGEALEEQGRCLGERPHSHTRPHTHTLPPEHQQCN